MNKLTLVLSCCLITLTGSAQRYTLDPGHTAITSKVLRFGIVKVVGRFTDVSGVINFNPLNPAVTTAEIVIKTESYSANNVAGEEAVKGSAFMDVNSFPEMKMSVKGLTKSDHQFVVSASLTIHGVTRNVSFTTVINGPALDLPTQRQSIGISGTFTINRYDYEIKMNGKLSSGAEVIDKEIEIEINALAIAD